MESVVGRAVIDEAGIAARYDFKLNYSNPEGMLDAVRKLGLPNTLTTQPPRCAGVSSQGTPLTIGD